MALPFFNAKENVIGSAAPDAFYLGRYHDRASDRVGPKIQIPGNEPIVVIGRNRAGKDSAIGQYNGLRLQKKTWFALEPRAEGPAICGPYRRTLGPTYIINPDGLHTDIPGYEDLKSDKRNPLLGMDWGPRLFDEAAGKAEAWIQMEGTQPHFTRRARQIMHAFIMWEVQQAAIEGRPPSLSNVRAAFTEADEFGPVTGAQLKGLAVTARRMVAEGGPQIASLAASFASKMSEEIAGARATADGQSQWVLSPLMHADMNTAGGVDFRQLGERPCTCFVTLPQYMNETHAPFVREAVSSALRALYKPSNTVCTFWLNEFATLGRMEAIESALGMVAGCGIQLIFVLQSLTQLKLHYGDGWENFMAQAAAWVLVGPPANDFDATYLSDRSGEMSIKQPNVGSNLNAGGGMGFNTGAAYSRKPFLMKQDLYNIPVDSGLGWVWATGLSNPIPAYFPPYWDVKSLKPRRNPYYKG